VALGLSVDLPGPRVPSVPSVAESEPGLGLERTWPACLSTTLHRFSPVGGVGSEAPWCCVSDPDAPRTGDMSTIALAPQTPAADQYHGFVTHLVIRCGRGDETALADLFDLTFFFVAASLRRTSLSPTGINEEVVKAFRRIWRHSADYQPHEQDVLAWIFDQTLSVDVPVRGLAQYRAQRGAATA